MCTLLIPGPPRAKFLCALPRDARPAWAKRMSELLSPTGRLICQEFPCYKPLHFLGPPWGLRPEIYLAHLSRPGAELPYGEDGQLTGDESQGPPSEGALKRLDHFRPRRSYKSGYDSEGNVVDYTSVWSH